ncbi:MAG: hypothetical protein G3M78_12860 [Candidatus Nitrohelix vancouverensis]|uniref:Uncharacterized protein n=1 Tax=Candidatus Nitrohelix vancouverensis TaxID=2705534 RepID=A0A7T0C4B4_9BACT|nr:MAG: hypothetical protein G3M78_12860 [Candidatus Nitrohelix vancouverensis]
MSAQKILTELKKHIPFRVYGKGPVIELFRELNCVLDKNTPLEIIDAFRDNESGEIVCYLQLGGQKATAALTNLKLDISHPMYRTVKNYRNEVANAIAEDGAADVNKSSFRVGDLYKKK